MHCSIQALLTDAIILRLSRYLNIFITRSTRKDRNTRNDRTDLQSIRQCSYGTTGGDPSKLGAPHCGAITNYAKQLTDPHSIIQAKLLGINHNTKQHQLLGSCCRPPDSHWTWCTCCRAQAVCHTSMQLDPASCKCKLDAPKSCQPTSTTACHHFCNQLYQAKSHYCSIEQVPTV